MSNSQWQRKRSILQQLSSGQFVSGEVLAAQFGISRTAVAKQIAAMAEYGVDIYSVKGKGYKLFAPIYLIDEGRLLAETSQRCFYFDDIPSTNAFLMEHLTELQSGDFCIAEFQSAGRGRRGKRWISPYGSHLYFSMYWHLPQGMSQAMGLSLVVGCALVRVLQKLGVNDIGLKWPNDVYLAHKKLAGILVEMSGTADSGCHLVVGIGVNVAMPESQGNLIDQPWADLQQVPELDKTLLAIGLQQQLRQDLKLFEQQGLAPFKERWHGADLYLGQAVRLLLGNDSISGIYQGIDEQGGVIIQTEEGIKHFVGGEISLRGA